MRIQRIGRLAAGATALTLALAGLTQPATAAAEGEVVQAREHYVGQYIVILKENAEATASGSAIQSTANSLVSTYGGELSSLYTVSLHGYSVRSMTEKQAKRLAADPAVRTVYEDGTVRGADVQPNPTWGLDRVDQQSLPLDKNYEYNATGEGVTVYDIDSGLRKSHQDFEGRASWAYDFFDKDNDASDCHGHGTHTAATAVGKTYGVAKKAKVVALRVFGCDNSGPDSATVDAVEWVTKNGVKPAVVNMSLYMYDVGVGDEQIKASIKAGFVYTIAAGNNNGKDACQISPARVTEGITVASTDSSDRRSSFSNIGTCVDIFAPGSNVTSASHSSDSGSAGMSGTSMSTPHVTGAAALYLQGKPNATPAEVAKAIIDASTPDKVSGPGTGSPNKLLYTKGIGGGTNPPGDPVAKFAASCPPGGLVCSFDGSASSDSDGTISSYAWDFGDSATGEGVKPSHTYATAGTYTVKLTVTDDSGKTNSTQQSVQVGSTGGGQKPTANFTTQCQQTACAFDGSTSRDADGTISSYAWSFGDNTTGNGVKISHTYPNVSATYTAKLTVTDNSGNTATAEKRVQCYSYGGSQASCFGTWN